MKYSKLFGKATKNKFKQASATSHQLLLQAGYIRQLSAGRFTLLPLGLKVNKKIEAIIRKEIDKIGAQELIVPTLHPIELWQQANRDKKFGASMMRVTDRNNAEFTLGATAEVIMLDLVKQFTPTYKDLPVNIYQFSQKFRDEARATGGLLRVREFIMKDGYSFHKNEKSLLKTYQKYWQAYLNIFNKFKLDTLVVESDNGAIGGSISHEFMVETPVGEDFVVKCDKCDYAANLETAQFLRQEINLKDAIKPFEIISQPEWVETMEDNVKHYKLPKTRFLKNVVYKDSDGTIVVGVIRGDLSVSKAKLAKVYGAKGDLEPATDKDLESIGTKYGWVHCWGHKAVYVGDLSLKTVRNFIGGLKEKDTDSTNVNYDRDFKCQMFGDIAEAQSDSTCAKCKQGRLKLLKCVEVGNIFNIGYTYSQAMDGFFIDKSGKPKHLYMGSYGIGLGRAMATIVEKHHDKNGIVWPKSVTPYMVHLIGLDLHEKLVLEKADSLYRHLKKKHISVLYDNRLEDSAGSKFADADLIGIPVRIVISKKSTEKGGFEYKVRSEKQFKILDLKSIVDTIVKFYS